MPTFDEWLMFAAFICLIAAFVVSNCGCTPRDDFRWREYPASQPTITVPVGRAPQQIAVTLDLTGDGVIDSADVSELNRRFAMAIVHGYDMSIDYNGDGANSPHDRQRFNTLRQHGHTGMIYPNEPACEMCRYGQVSVHETENQK